MSEFGIYGMGAMCQNLALNIASKGFKVSICNGSASPLQVDATLSRASEEGIDSRKLTGYTDTKEFIQSLSRPRKVIILVTDGEDVDGVIEDVTAHMEQGDVIVDGGNGWHQHSINRSTVLEERDFLYLGLGISGGEEGVRSGPCLMPGGNKMAFHQLLPMFEKISAKIPSKADKNTLDACVAYMGPCAGGGHYVKMVQTGIEYGLIEIITEIYGVLKKGASLSDLEIAHIFQRWNQSEVESYFLSIASEILLRPDDKSSTLYELLTEKISGKERLQDAGKLTGLQAAEVY